MSSSQIITQWEEQDSLCPAPSEGGGSGGGDGNPGRMLSLSGAQGELACLLSTC